MYIIIVGNKNHFHCHCHCQKKCGSVVTATDIICPCHVHVHFVLRFHVPPAVFRVPFYDMTLYRLHYVLFKVYVAVYTIFIMSLYRETPSLFNVTCERCVKPDQMKANHGFWIRICLAAIKTLNIYDKDIHVKVQTYIFIYPYEVVHRWTILKLCGCIWQGKLFHLKNRRQP